MVNGTTLWAIEDLADGHTIPNYGVVKAIFPKEEDAVGVVEHFNSLDSERFEVVEVEVWKKKDIQVLLDKSQPF